MKGQSAKAPEDLRVTKTRHAIQEAFERLLETTEYPHITVSAIAREARISRKTFYAHYRSVDELIQNMAVDIIARVARDIQPDGELLTLEEWMAAFTKLVFSTVENNPHLNANVIRCMQPSAMLEMLREPLLNTITIELEKRGYRMQPDHYYNMVFYLGGLSSVYEAWQLEGQPASALDDIAERIAHTAWSGLSAVVMPL